MFFVLLFTTIIVFGIWLGVGLNLSKAPWPKKTKQTLPSWFTKPYRDANHCYGCGLDPWIMIPGKAIYCYGCWYLREEIESTPRTYQDFDEESWKASFKFHKHLPMGPAPGAHSSAGTVIVTNGKTELYPGGIVRSTLDGVEYPIQYKRGEAEIEFEKAIQRLRMIDDKYPATPLSPYHQQEWDRLVEKVEMLKERLAL